MITTTRQTDEHREAGPMECWCLHGSMGMAADFRGLAAQLAKGGVSTHAVDLWRFLQCQPLPVSEFGKTLNADVAGRVFRGSGRILLGYSMGGRLALHALLEADPPWQAAVIVSAHPGLENPGDRAARMTADAAWAGKALTLGWKDVCNEWNQQDVLDGTIPRDPGTESAMALHRREIARGFVDWSLGAQQPLWERLPEIRIPVLWVVGEKDAKFRALAERAAPLIPRATLAVAPNAGHRVPWSAADWFANTVVSFLRTGPAPI